MKTAIIIVNYQTPWHLKQCLKSVYMHTKDFHILLVHNNPDNNSLKVSKRFIQKYPETITQIVNNENLGFVGGVNSAYKEAMQYQRICLLNSDAIVTKNWLVELNKPLDEDESVVQVSPDSNQFYPDSKIWALGKKYLSKIWPWLAWELAKLQSMLNPPSAPIKSGFHAVEDRAFYLFPGGFCNIFRSKYFKDLGYILDKNIVHGYWDDFDLAMYLRKFGKVGATNKSYVFHFVNMSINRLKKNNEYKERIKHFNGLYVMNKWSKEIEKCLSYFSTEERAGLKSSYVAKMYFEYRKLVKSKPLTKEYIESLPAKAFESDFLGWSD